jgi:DNA gyrase/topoisomerase IV subunit A
MKPAATPNKDYYQLTMEELIEENATMNKVIQDQAHIIQVITKKIAEIKKEFETYKIKNSLV